MNNALCNNDKGNPVMGCALADAPAPKQKQQVNPIIQPAKFVVVVRKFFKDSAGNRKPYTKPRRQRVVLTTSSAFDGTGTFACTPNDKIKFFRSPNNDDAIRFDGKSNVFQGAALAKGIPLYAEGATPSAALNDVKLTLQLAGGSKVRGPDATSTASAVEVTLDICKGRQAVGANPPPLSPDDKIAIGRNLLVQDAGGHFARAQLVVQVTPSTFTGTLIVKAKNHVTAFTNETSTKGEIEALPYTIPDASKIPVGGDRRLWAEGKTPSKDVLDSGFSVAIKDLEDDADHVGATSVQVQLDICQSRKTAAGLPDPMSAEDKVKIGRFIHEQDARGQHGRALLIVRKLQPEKFKGTVFLRGTHTNKIELFPNERKTAGEAAIGLACQIDYDPKNPAKRNDDKKFWVQGKSGGVSGALRDVGLWLHLKEDAPVNPALVSMTVVKFTNFTADIPMTPARNVRYGNSPVGRHSYVRSGALADHFDEDDTKNLPFALVENSVRAPNPVKLSVKVAPAGVLVSWSVRRDSRPAPNGDDADVAALSGVPTQKADGAFPADATKREILADAVGTFHIRPFVDCNGNGTFEPYIDPEPNILMIMVLIRVQGFTNTSVPQQANAAAAITGNAGGVPSSANGVSVATGNFLNGANDAVHQIATATVIGGGDHGRRGLDMLFAGWMNNEIDTGPNGEDGVATYTHTPAPVPVPVGPPIPLPAVPRYRISVRVNPGARPPANPATGGRDFLPGGPAAPAAWDMGPVLDTSINVNAGTGGNTVVGTEGAIGPPIPIVKANVQPGQRWTVEMWDSPGDSAPTSHGGYAPTRLVAYRFNLDFRTDLVFWTNTAKTAAATAANEPAHRLYSTVQTNTWSIRAAVNFDATGTAIPPLPATATVTLNKDANPNRLATPLDSQPAETRGPQLLSMLAVDARN
jgi:hypothetical protein